MKSLMKIRRAEFGFGGYQDAQIGLHLDFFSGKDESGIAVSHSIAVFPDKVGDAGFRAVMVAVQKLLDEAGVSTVSQLKGTPVEVTFDGNEFVDFRVLTEVL